MLRTHAPGAARRWTAGAAAAVLLAAGLQVATASAAAALPENCTITYQDSPRIVTSLCTAGTGDHQIMVRSQSPNPQIPDVLWLYGERAPVGSLSTVHPPFHVTGAWVIRR